MTKHCGNRPEEEEDKDEALQKAKCNGYVVGVDSVWTETQCLDNCLRHPRCDKYIFNGPGNQACELLNTGHVRIAGVVNLPKKTGACGPRNILVSVSQKLTISRRDFKCHVYSTRRTARDHVTRDRAGLRFSKYVSTWRGRFSHKPFTSGFEFYFMLRKNAEVE